MVSALALALSVTNLYLQRRDRRPRLRIRARYEYRAVVSGGADEGDGLLQVHDDSQEGLYMLLGDFLREHGLRYPQGTPMVRFSVSNEGSRTVYLDGVRIVFRPGGRYKDRMVLDPVESRVLSYELAEGAGNVIGRGGGRQRVELVPGDGVGYRFGLIRLANTLMNEGYTGNIRLALEVTDRLGGVHRHPFSVSTDLWAYPKEDG